MTWLRTRPTQPSWELESCWFWSSREIMIHGNWKRWLGLGNLFCWMLWMLDFPNVFFLLTPIFRLAHVPTGIYKENTWPPQVQVLGDFSWADDSPFLIRNSPMWVPENKKNVSEGDSHFSFSLGGIIIGTYAIIEDGFGWAKIFRGKCHDWNHVHQARCETCSKSNWFYLYYYCTFCLATSQFLKVIFVAQIGQLNTSIFWHNCRYVRASQPKTYFW